MAKSKQRPTFEKRRREREKADKRADKREMRKVRAEEREAAGPPVDDPENAPDGPSLNREDLDRNDMK